MTYVTTFITSGCYRIISTKCQQKLLKSCGMSGIIGIFIPTPISILICMMIALVLGSLGAFAIKCDREAKEDAV
ncbi:hypothetical protein SAMN02910263_03427 [Butyrivibrio sp. INlla16]|nr:hypothetical protein SAMN02910263_03427 [Butyrivibrio sp. INlla16]